MEESKKESRALKSGIKRPEIERFETAREDL